MAWKKSLFSNKLFTNCNFLLDQGFKTNVVSISPFNAKLPHLIARPWWNLYECFNEHNGIQNVSTYGRFSLNSWILHKKSILIYSLLLSSNFLMMPTSAEMRKSYRRWRHFHLPSTPGRNHSHTISFSYSHFRFSRPDRSRPGSGIMSVQTGTLPSNPLCPTAETVTNTRVT